MEAGPSIHLASKQLTIESSPLVLYYCFMNAAKALLSAKRVVFDASMSVGAHKMRGPTSKVVLSNEGIRIRNKGIVPALSAYFSEVKSSKTHSLEDVLYNLVFIHRTYCLTYPRSKERFLPLKNAEFVRDTATGEVWFRANLVDDANWRFFKRVLPSEVVEEEAKTKSITSVTKIIGQQMIILLTWN